MSNQDEKQPTADELEARRKSNQEESDEAHRLASEQQQRDLANGVKPVVSSVAESIKAKLQRDEFSVYTDEDGNVVPPARAAS